MSNDDPWRVKNGLDRAATALAMALASTDDEAITRRLVTAVRAVNSASVINQEKIRRSDRPSKWSTLSSEYREMAIQKQVAHRRQRNAEKRVKATSHRKQWTGAEMDVVSRDDLTHAQAADMLGRTIFAVKTMRKRLRSKGQP